MNPNLTEQERNLFELLHRDREGDARTFNKPDYKGIWAGVVDKYKEKAHFVYELLQNADDANATEAVFTLERSRLIFRHNGTVRFTVSSVNDSKNKGHINAITGVGNSTKGEENGNTIGKFGVGFKAVFQYTTEPHIYDDSFWFKIEQFIIPTMLDEDFPGRKKGETIFVFPFSSPATSYDEIVQRLSKLDNPIIFLRNLKKVVIELPHDVHLVYDKTITFHRQKDDVTHELLTITNGDTNQRIHMFTKPIEVVEEGGKRYHQYISVGYHLKENGDLDDKIQGKVFCFFPTAEDFHLHCIVHAPFLLVDSRQQLKEDKINENLKNELAELTAEALLILRDYGIATGHLLVNENIFNFIPTATTNSLLDNTFRAKYIRLMQREPMLLGRGGKYVSSHGALICSPISMMKLLSDQQIQELCAYGYNNQYDEIKPCWTFLRDETQKIYKESYVKTILDELGVRVFSGSELARLITPNFMELHGFEWAIRLYRYLKDDARSLWDKNTRYLNQPFRYAPIFLSQNGEWIAPFKMLGKEEQPNIYLPIGNSKGSYNLIHPSLIEHIDKSILEFYEELGIKKPDIIDFIQKHILPKYSQDEIEDEALIEDIYSVLEILDDDANNRRKNDIVDLIKKHIKLVGTDSVIYDPNDLYIASSNLQCYFKGNGNVVYVDVDFYYNNTRYVTKDDLLRFFITLGVNTSPRVREITQTDTNSFNKKRLTEVDFSYSSRGYIIKDYIIEGFTNLIEGNLTEDSSLYIWSVLAKMDKDIENYLTGYYDYFYHSNKREKFESSLVDYLRNSKWIINVNGNPCSVKDITQEDLLSLGYEKSDFLFEILAIKKRAKSLSDLGATEDQQRQQKLGEVAEKWGVRTPEELEEKLKKSLEEPKKKRETNQRANNGHGHHPQQSDGQTCGTFGSLPDGKEPSDLDDLFGDTELELSIPSSSGTHHRDSSNHKNLEDLKRKLEDNVRKKLEIEALRQETEELPKYTKEWFKKKLELEYRNSSAEDRPNESIKRSVSISFSRIILDSINKRLYELRNPSRDIPLWVEEVENITINFLFNNRDVLSCSFEVANVRDYSLRLKAKAADAEELASLDWRQFTKATLDINNPTNLINNFRRAFNQLLLPDGFNLKQNLHNNISFVFGPPGTGKTTYLANRIVSEINNSCRNVYRILVLAPTNKACDVLVRKIMDIEDNYTWLGRFVTSGDTEIENMGVVCDRDSDLYSLDKCCLVTTMARLPYDGFTDGVGFHALREIDWNLVICDEASMLPIAHIVYAIYNFKNVPFLIAGDPMQIAPIDVTNNWDSENIYDMVNLKSFDSPKTEPIQFNIQNLETQYRSIPVIGGLFSDYAYNGCLQHHWKQSDQLPLNIKELPLKSINFIPFRVERYDSMFGAKKLAGSPIHIYSALMCSQLGRFIAKKYVENNPDEEDLSIGIVCPYASQAQLIQKMIEQMTDIPQDVSITIGTVHSFQGDQCNIIMAMLNPPTGLKRLQASWETHINNKNIINVAISRAKDYLCLLIPDKESCDGFDNLIEVKRLGAIASSKYRSDTALFTATQIEQIIFGQPHFLEANSFITSHQLANVYTTATSLYEVRVDENSVDIQIGDDSKSNNQ